MKAILITNNFYLQYFCKVKIDEGYLVIIDNKKYLFTDSRYFYAIKNILKDIQISCLLYEGLLSIKNFLDKYRIKTLGIDYKNTTVAGYFKLKKFFKLEDCSSYIEELRSVKDETESDLIKKSCEICEKSFYEVLPLIKQGVTELEIKNALLKNFIKNGAECESFDLIVAFGENSAVPHHKTDETILQKNQPVLIDMGCKYKGYSSDYTRTLFYGEPSSKFVKYYNLVKEANELAEEKINIKMTTKEADNIARDYFKKNDVDKYFTHALGHGLGLEIHEYPYLSPKIENKLKDGQFFTIEPGLYFDGEFGIRIEDTVKLSNGKIERMFSDSKDLIIIK